MEKHDITAALRSKAAICWGLMSERHDNFGLVFFLLKQLFIIRDQPKQNLIKWDSGNLYGSSFNRCSRSKYYYVRAISLNLCLQATLNKFMNELISNKSQCSSHYLINEHNCVATRAFNN